jgi:hypothetical protein
LAFRRKTCHNKSTFQYKEDFDTHDFLATILLLYIISIDNFTIDEEVTLKRATDKGGIWTGV